MKLTTKTNGFSPCGEKGNESSAEQLISVKQLAELCSISERATWRLLASGVLPKPIKMGRCTRFFRSDVSRCLDGLREQRA